MFYFIAHQIIIFKFRPVFRNIVYYRVLNWFCVHFLFEQPTVLQKGTKRKENIQYYKKGPREREIVAKKMRPTHERNQGKRKSLHYYKKD